MSVDPSTGSEQDILCARCGKEWVPVDSGSVICGPCLSKPAPATDGRIEVLALRSQQAAFMAAVDELIAIYRDIDHVPRRVLKERLKSFYERIQELGARIGISRQSLDHLWKG